MHIQRCRGGRWRNLQRHRKAWHVNRNRTNRDYRVIFRRIVVATEVGQNCASAGDSLPSLILEPSCSNRSTCPSWLMIIDYERLVGGTNTAYLNLIKIFSIGFQTIFSALCYRCSSASYENYTRRFSACFIHMFFMLSMCRSPGSLFVHQH
jgi:hypothetical protein